MALKFGLLILRKTYTFEIQAHEHIYVKPGSDGALALGYASYYSSRRF